jgi:hypothetical protein
VGAADDREAIEALIRGFLDDAAQGKFPPDYWTGPVAEAFALGTEVGEITPVPLDLRRGSTRVEKLQVGRIEGDSARAELRADCLSIVDVPIGGERTVRRRYGGGVVLQRVGTEWRLVTLRQEGVDIASSLFDPVRTIERADGAEIEVAARYLKTTWLGLIVVRNVSDDAVVLGKVTIEGKVWGLFVDGGTVRRAPLVLRSGARWGIAWTGKTGPLRRAQTVRARINEHDLRIQVRPPRRPMRHVIRASLHPNAAVHLVALLALLTVPFTERGLAALGIALLAAGLLNFGSEVLSYLAGARFSAQLLYGAVGLVELAIALYLVHREHVGVFGIVTSLLIAVPVLWFKAQVHLHARRTDRAEIVRDPTGELDGA